MVTFDQGQGGSDAQYTKSQATRLIKKISKEGSTRPSPHAKKQMKKRHISTQDILQAFKNGRIFDEPEPHIKTGNWLYKILGNGIDNSSLQVVVHINEKENYLLVISAY